MTKASRKKKPQPATTQVVRVIDCYGEIAGYWCPYCNIMLVRGDMLEDFQHTEFQRCKNCRRALDWVTPIECE